MIFNAGRFLWGSLQIVLLFAPKYNWPSSHGEKDKKKEKKKKKRCYDWIRKTKEFLSEYDV